MRLGWGGAPHVCSVQPWGEHRPEGLMECWAQWPLGVPCVCPACSRDQASKPRLPGFLPDLSAAPCPGLGGPGTDGLLMRPHYY